MSGRPTISVNSLNPNPEVETADSADYLLSAVFGLNDGILRQPVNQDALSGRKYP